MAGQFISYGSRNGGGGAGGTPLAAWVQCANYMDSASSSRPSSVYSPDGTPVADGDIVLFTALSAENNRAYRATVSGGSVTWTLQGYGKNQNGVASLGDMIFVVSGSTHASKLLVFNGSSFQTPV